MYYYYGSRPSKMVSYLQMGLMMIKEKLKMKSETKEINENYPHSISVTGYTMRQMELEMNKKK